MVFAWGLCCSLGGGCDICVSVIPLLGCFSGTGWICLGGESVPVVRGLPISDPSGSVLRGLSDGRTLPPSGTQRVVTVGWEVSTVVVVVVGVWFWTCCG